MGLVFIVADSLIRTEQSGYLSETKNDDCLTDFGSDSFTACPNCMDSDRAATQLDGCFATSPRNGNDLICDRPHGSLGFSALVDTLSLWVALCSGFDDWASTTQTPAQAAV
ncbi:hypothetical protein GS682_00125 [Nostoc sp. B(2019)]|nr:hypothetical protein [Nostoc sp. B(2019)]